MHERGIRHMPVLGDDGRMVGIISDRDIRRPRFTDEPNLLHVYAPDNQHKVADAMTPDPFTVDAGDDVVTALNLMVHKRVGAVPVLEAGRLAGMLSQVDLLRAFRDHLRGVGA
jgi:acetoin utilization protein AcuB